MLRNIILSRLCEIKKTRQAHATLKIHVVNIAVVGLFELL